MSIFDEQVARKPNNYPWTKEFIKAMHDGQWSDSEFSFTSDKQDFKVSMTEEERVIIMRTLSAIGQIEIDVKKFWARLGENLPHPSLYDLGITMANIEVIHNNAYERLLEELDLGHIFENNLSEDVVKGRISYLKKHNHKYYKDSKKQYVYALALFTLFVENVSLFSQFYIVLWFERYRNVLKDTAQQVNYTKREEDIHAKVGIKLINTIRGEFPELFDAELESKILYEAEQAFNAESKIIDWIVGEWSDTRISAHILKEYVKSRINDSLYQIGFKQIFEIDVNAKRDFEWMDEDTLGNNSTDFFFQRPTDYAKNITIDEGDLI
jgi:ribonucleoside-diphosphate reductase beta chain